MRRLLTTEVGCEPFTLTLTNFGYFELEPENSVQGAS
jgi:hypothetical protein